MESDTRTVVISEAHSICCAADLKFLTPLVRNRGYSSTEKDPNFPEADLSFFRALPVAGYTAIGIAPLRRRENT